MVFDFTGKDIKPCEISFIKEIEKNCQIRAEFTQLSVKSGAMQAYTDLADKYHKAEITIMRIIKKR